MGDATSGLCRLSFNPQLRVEFRGATVTFDAGLLWPREVDERLGLGALIERPLTDPRTGHSRQVPLPDLFRQSISSRLAGYEDTNDAERLAAEAQGISCSASPCVTARERRRALQVRGDADADGARPGSFVVLYRTTQSDNAVQDTERSADCLSQGACGGRRVLLLERTGRGANISECQESRASLDRTGSSSPASTVMSRRTCTSSERTAPAGSGSTRSSWLVATASAPES
jgi:hypothetical protein